MEKRKSHNTKNAVPSEDAENPKRKRTNNDAPPPHVAKKVKPNDNPDAKRLHISNLPYDLDKRSIRSVVDLLSAYGEVVDHHFPMEGEQAKGYGWVTMATHEQALGALSMHGTQAVGRALKVAWAEGERVPGGRGSEGVCFACGATGHVSASCPSGKGRNCFVCGEAGHMSRACPNATDATRGGCFHCKGTDHKAAECPMRGKAVVAPVTNTCFACGKAGHVSAKCPSGKGSNCFLCGQPGHRMNACPGVELTGAIQSKSTNNATREVKKTIANEESGKKGKRDGASICFLCGLEGHRKTNCPKLLGGDL